MTALLQTVAFPPTGDTLWASRHEGGKVYVAVKPICLALGLDWHSQRQRIHRTAVLNEGEVMITSPSAGGEQQTLCLPLDLLPGWLFGVDVNRVKEALRPKLLAFQRECFTVLWSHFNGDGAATLADNDPISPLSADNDDGDDDAAAESVADTAVDLDDMPERTLALKLTMVREARLLGGRVAAKRLWRRLKLPELDEREGEPPVVVDPLSLFIAERLMAAQGVRTRSEDIWRAYLDWATRQGCDVVGRKTFGLALSERFRPIKSGVMWYRDVAIRPTNSPAPLSA